MKKIFNLAIALLAVTSMALTSCSDVKIPEDPANKLPGVTDLSYTANGREVTITWTLPTNGEIEAVRVIQPNGVVAELEPDATEFFVPRIMVDTEVLYTVKVAYKDGLVSHGNTLKLYVQAPPRKVAYLTEYASVDDVEDDDEAASYRWFTANYAENGDVLVAAENPVIDVEDYSVVWIHIDREGIAAGYRNLPKDMINSKLINTLKNYLKEGGNILLTNHATQLVTPLQRTAAGYAPNIFASGEGDTGDDVWTINANIGNTYDHRSHPIFAGMDSNDNIFGYPTFPLIGPGQREDHNCMWDFNSYKYTVEGANTVQQFEKQCDATVLAAWGQVTDFACAGLIEFSANAKFNGTVLAIGLAAYEWNQNSGANLYQANIEKLTANSIEYLSHK